MGSTAENEGGSDTPATASEVSEDPVELENAELINDIRLLLRELIDKVAAQEEGLDQDDEHEDVEDEGAAAEEQKEVRDFNNIIFPEPLREGEDEILGAHALNYHGPDAVSTEFGIGDFAGADHAHSCEESDADKEEIKIMVEDIKQDLLLLQSELSCTESVDLEQYDAQNEFFEDVEAEEEVFTFREALAKLDAETIQSFIEVKPAVISDELELQEEFTTTSHVNFDFLYPPPMQDAELRSSDEEGATSADTNALVPAPDEEKSKPAESHTHPFTNWIRACQDNYRQSKSNSCCGESKIAKKIRFASQAQIIPASSKYISDEEPEQPPLEFSLPPCSKNGSIKGEGLALRNKPSIEDAEAEADEIQNEEGTMEEFVNDEIIRKASELSIKLQETLSDYFSTLGNQAAYEVAGRSQEAEADECSCTESIECVPEEEEDTPTLHPRASIVATEVENEESDIEEWGSPIQKLSTKSFLNLYMTESQKSCGATASAANNAGASAAKVTPNEYQLTEAEVKMIRGAADDLLIDHAGGLLDKATFILHAVGSATSIDDEFIHSEEWKELMQAEEQSGCRIEEIFTDEEEGAEAEGTRRQSEYEHLYAYLTDKAKERLKEKIEARNRFFDSCKAEQAKAKAKSKSLPVTLERKHKPSPHPFQFVDGWSQFDFRYEYGYYNNYCISRTGLQSPRISPRGAAVQNSIKIQVQSILHELRHEEDLVHVCSRGRGQKPREGKGRRRQTQPQPPRTVDSLPLYSSNVITATEPVIEKFFDISELEQEAEARNRTRGHNGYEFTAAAAEGAERRSPSLVGLPRTPPLGSLPSLQEEDLCRKQNNTNISITPSAEYGKEIKEIVTDLDAIPTLQDGDKRPPPHQQVHGKNDAVALAELSNDSRLGLGLERSNDNNQRSQPEPPKPAARKSSFSFLLRLFGSTSSLASACETERQQKLKKQSLTNFLLPFLSRKS